MKTFRELIIWQKSMSLVTYIYHLTKSFPDSEKFGLTAQVRRCSVSIPSNIAEGYGRNSLNEYIRFLNISNGSLFEFQTQVEIAFNLEFLNKKDFEKVFEDSREIERMLSSLIRKLNEKRK